MRALRLSEEITLRQTSNLSARAGKLRDRRVRKSEKFFRTGEPAGGHFSDSLDRRRIGGVEQARACRRTS